MDTDDAIRIQPSLRHAAERAATADGISVTQLVNVALAEKLAVLETASWLGARGRRGEPGPFIAYLDRAGDAPPQEGDELKR